MDLVNFNNIFNKKAIKIEQKCSPSLSKHQTGDSTVFIIMLLSLTLHQTLH